MRMNNWSELCRSHFFLCLLATTAACYFEDANSGPETDKAPQDCVKQSSRVCSNDSESPGIYWADSCGVRGQIAQPCLSNNQCLIDGGEPTCGCPLATYPCDTGCCAGPVAIEENIQATGPMEVSFATDGSIWVCYSDEIEQRIRVAQYSGQQWKYFDIDETMQYGAESVFVFPSDGSVELYYISEIDYGLGELKRATWDGELWSVEAITRGDIGGLDVELDETDRAHVTYVRSVDDDGYNYQSLIYMREAAGDWISETIVEEARSLRVYSALDLDPQNLPHIIVREYLPASSFHMALSAIRHHFFDGTQWNYQLLFDLEGPYCGIDASGFQINDNGVGYLLFSTFQHDPILYLMQKSTDNQWSTPVEVSPNGASEGELVLDNAGLPHFVSIAATDRHLGFGFADTTHWLSDYFYESTDNIWHCAMALDANDVAHIGFIDEATDLPIIIVYEKE